MYSKLQMTKLLIKPVTIEMHANYVLSSPSSMEVTCPLVCFLKRTLAIHAGHVFLLTHMDPVCVSLSVERKCVS